jgi:hypothetical protein
MESGTRLGPYEIRDKIGAGSMGEVADGWIKHGPTTMAAVAMSE